MEATEVKQVPNTVRELLSMGKTSQAVNLLIALGHGHHVTVGALTTPIVGGGNGTTIVLAQPQGLMTIGSNQAMIPVRIKVECEVGLIAADSEVDEILIAADRLAAAGGLNITTIVPEVVFNMRTDLGSSEGGEVQAYSAITEDIDAPTLGLELDRAQNFRDFQEAATPATVATTQFELLYEPDDPPIIAGKGTGAAIYVYWGGTVAVSGFAQMQVVVFPSAWLKTITA